MMGIRRVVAGYRPEGSARVVSGERVGPVSPDQGDRLQSGDWLTVNSVPHSCRNDLDEPAALAGIVIGTHHGGVPLRTKKAAAAGLDGSGLRVPELGPEGA